MYCTVVVYLEYRLDISRLSLDLVSLQKSYLNNYSQDTHSSPDSLDFDKPIMILKCHLQNNVFFLC